MSQPSKNKLIEMYDKMIEHIKRKLYGKDEVLDDFDVPSDEQVKYYMLATFEIVKNECQKCFFCKNYRRFTINSLCKIKPHATSNCFHFTLDIQKVLKKKYYKIIMTITECTWGRHITNDFNLSVKSQKNMIYESIRLYEMMACWSEVHGGNQMEVKDNGILS